jgi:hypothetical protein
VKLHPTALAITLGRNIRRRVLRLVLETSSRHKALFLALTRLPQFCLRKLFSQQIGSLANPANIGNVVRALRRRKIPAGYLLFAGEGHGFKKAESIERALDAELYFYSANVFRTRLVF